MPCLVSDLTGGRGGGDVTPQFGLPSLALGQAVADYFYLIRETFILLCVFGHQSERRRKTDISFAYVSYRIDSTMMTKGVIKK
jgi:hypothetical protein